MKHNPIAVAITGASGVDYALILLEHLIKAGEKVYLMISPAALIVINSETSLRLPSKAQAIQKILCAYYQAADGQLRVFAHTQWTAPVASGSNPPRAMVIAPCTNGTLAAIASGLSRNLIERAADVVLKEQKKLILLHRETPLSVIQLENMLRLARAGAVVMPANPGFYYQPKTVREVVDFVVARMLDHLDIEHDLLPRWGEKVDDLE